MVKAWHTQLQRSRTPGADSEWTPCRRCAWTGGPDPAVFAPRGLPARTRRTMAAGGGIRSGSGSAVSGWRKSSGGVCGIVSGCVGEGRKPPVPAGAQDDPSGAAAFSRRGGRGGSVPGDVPVRCDQSPTLEALAQPNSHHGPPPLVLQNRLQPARHNAGPEQSRGSGRGWSCVAPVRWEALTSRISCIPADPVRALSNQRSRSDSFPLATATTCNAAPR